MEYLFAGLYEIPLSNLFPIGSGICWYFVGFSGISHPKKKYEKKLIRAYLMRYILAEDVFADLYTKHEKYNQIFKEDMDFTVVDKIQNIGFYKQSFV
jgi:hypothetical protein